MDHCSSLAGESLATVVNKVNVDFTTSNWLFWWEYWFYSSNKLKTYNTLRRGIDVSSFPQLRGKGPEIPHSLIRSCVNSLRLPVCDAGKVPPIGFPDKNIFESCGNALDSNHCRGRGPRNSCPSRLRVDNLLRRARSGERRPWARNGHAPHCSVPSKIKINKKSWVRKIFLDSTEQTGIQSTFAFNDLFFVFSLYNS